MSILNKPKQPSSSPPAAPVPRIVPQPRVPIDHLHEDAVRFGQYIAELRQTAARLQAELDDMTTRAKLAEEEVRRLDTRIAHMEKAMQERETILIEQRDHWKMQYNDVERSLQLAGGIILDVVKKSENRRTANVNLDALSRVIEQSPEQPIEEQAAVKSVIDDINRDIAAKHSNPQ